MDIEKKDIRHLSIEELKLFLTEVKEKAFRTNQIWEFLWKKGVTSYEEMTSLSKNLRAKLNENFTFNVVKISKVQVSKDKTVKFGFTLYDGLTVEGVLIPTLNRTTACISSQVGCRLGCKFCATGTLNFERNLTFTEIFDQVIAIQKYSDNFFHTPLSNIVYMGMGEPFENYEEVMKSTKILTSKEGLNISPYRITISTSGLTPQIRAFANDEKHINLAISLHAPIQNTRFNLMPIANKFRMSELIDALKYYHEKTGNRINIEYLLLDKINDTISHARELSNFCKNFPVKLNIIEYNSIKGLEFVKSTDENTEIFINALKKCNLIVNLRRSRGADIDAACGQLATKFKN